MYGRSALIAVAAAGLAWAAADPVEVEVRGVQLDPTTGSPVVQLVEKGKAGRALPIWIGPFEAQAIAAEMQGMPLPRPLTHDLMKRLVESLGGRLDHVVIGDLRDNTYIATLHLAGADGKDIAIDARPSDAIALALRLHGPILVADEVFAKSRATHVSPAAAHLWGLTVQDLTPDIAAFFKASAAKGVLVSDVGDDADAHEALRGARRPRGGARGDQAGAAVGAAWGARSDDQLPAALRAAGVARRWRSLRDAQISIDGSADNGVKPLDPRLAPRRASTKRRTHSCSIP